MCLFEDSVSELYGQGLGIKKGSAAWLAVLLPHSASLTDDPTTILLAENGLQMAPPAAPLLSAPHSNPFHFPPHFNRDFLPLLTIFIPYAMLPEQLVPSSPLQCLSKLQKWRICIIHLPGLISVIISNLFPKKPPRCIKYAYAYCLLECLQQFLC
jgi:hypothetical protein